MVANTTIGIGALSGLVLIGALIAVIVWYVNLPSKEDSKDPAKEDPVKEDPGGDGGPCQGLPGGKLSADGKTCTATIDGGDTSSSAGKDSSTPPETKDPGQQNGSDDAALTSGPCVYGGFSDGKGDDGFHCRLPDQTCPGNVPKKCWKYSGYKYYSMPGDTKAVKGKCPLGGTFDLKNCYLGPASTACPPGVKSCFDWKGSKYYSPITPV